MIRAILTDIEGTTSSISFVRDVLFPYAAQHIGDFVRAHRAEPAVRSQLDAAAEMATVDAADLDAIIAALQQWIREDRKVTPLKTLQGMLWEAGYRNSDYRAHLYPDAAEALRRWHAQGLALYVYSSGSIQAQKLFFAFSEAGDLTPLFSDYFDTTSGPKQEKTSYERIVKAIGLSAGEILFLSDIAAELDAASAAGLQTCWLVRPQDTTADAAAIAASPRQTVTSFNDIRLT